ncbi:MAG: hypothetical protein IKF17_02845 [Clostridia bacterium]|nr:hypothetical protein [Clostridia bacterium]
MKNMINKNKGITLIALVITIIVLLILTGITIASLTGENGLLSRAASTKEETRGAAVKEEIDLWNLSKIVDSKTGTTTAEGQAEFLNRLQSQKLITADERTSLEAGETITIGSKQISLEVSDLQKLQNYFTPQNGTRSWDDVWPESASTWVTFEGENMPDLSMLSSGPITYGDNEDSTYYDVYQYNNSYYKINYDENGVFTNVESYTLSDKELGNIIVRDGQRIGEDIDNEMLYYLYDGKYYKIKIDPSKERLTIESVEEYTPKDVTYAQIQGDYIEVPYNAASPFGAYEIAPASVGPLINDCITNIHEIEEIVNVISNDESLVKIVDSTDNPTAIFNVNIPGIREEYGLYPQGVVGETTITIVGKSGKTKNIVVKLVEP